MPSKPSHHPCRPTLSNPPLGPPTLPAAAAPGAPLYRHILTHHALTGGGFSILLDTSCRPRSAVPFSDAVGVDGSFEMINVARGEGTLSGALVIRLCYGDERLMIMREGTLVRYFRILGHSYEGAQAWWDGCAVDYVVDILPYIQGYYALQYLSTELCLMSSVSDACIIDTFTRNAAAIQNVLFEI